MELMQMLSQFTDGRNGLNISNAEQKGREIIRQANLNQAQLNKVQGAANMIYGMARRFGLIR